MSARPHEILAGVGRLVAAGGLCAALTQPAAGQGTPSWEILLRSQLTEQQNCTLHSFVNVRDVPLAGSVRREGRVRCTDGREFDFHREKENEKFIIRLCQPVVC